MTDKPYLIYVAPDDNKISGKRRFNIIEWASDGRIVHSLTYSLAEMLHVLNEMLSLTGDAKIIMETGCRSGQHLLGNLLRNRRAHIRVPSGTNVIWKKLYLTQLVKNAMYYDIDIGNVQPFSKILKNLKDNPNHDIDIYLGHFKDRILDSRSRGGMRRFIELDWLTANIAVNQQQVYKHPVYKLLHFFHLLLKINHDKYNLDLDALDSKLRMLTLEVCRLMQSPFPYMDRNVYNGWMSYIFNNDEGKDNEYSHTFVHGSRADKKVMKEDNPALYRVLLALNNCLGMGLNRLEDLGVFDPKRVSDRSGVLCSIFNMIFDYWAQAYYSGEDHVPQLLDLSILAPKYRVKFKKVQTRLEALDDGC